MSKSVAAIRSSTSTLRLALVVLAATSIEWYDFFLYATAAALVFPHAFFPASLPPTVGLLASFSTFSVGFIARPIGAVLFGHLGDRRGRRTALALALITMGLAATLIGCLPSYAQAGAIAPIALIILRFTQGLAVGGQWGGAVLLITEHVTEAKRGYYGSYAQAGVPVGAVLANSVFLVINLLTSADAIQKWAWRLPFLFSILLVVLGIYVYVRAHDNFVTGTARPPRDRSPLRGAFAHHSREIALAAGIFMAGTLIFYILLTFVLAYGTSATGLRLSSATMLAAVLTAMTFSIPATFLIGRLADRLGPRRTIMLGGVLSIAWAFSLFPLLDTRSFALIVLALCLGKVTGGIIYVPAAALVTGIFERSVRCSAASLSYQIGSVLGGGMAPVIATALTARFPNGVGVMVYMAVASLIALLCAAFIDESRAEPGLAQAG